MLERCCDGVLETRIQLERVVVRTHLRNSLLPEISDVFCRVRVTEGRISRSRARILPVKLGARPGGRRLQPVGLGAVGRETLISPPSPSPQKQDKATGEGEKKCAGDTNGYANHGAN